MCTTFMHTTIKIEITLSGRNAKFRFSFKTDTQVGNSSRILMPMYYL